MPSPVASGHVKQARPDGPEANAGTGSRRAGPSPSGPDAATGPHPAAAMVDAQQPNAPPPAQPIGTSSRLQATPGPLQSLALAQLELAMQTLRIAGPHDVEPAVHEARKAIKRVRTLIRLLDEDLTPRSRAREQEALRDASHLLMEARDAAVAVGTLRAVVRREKARLAGSIGAVRLRLLLAEQKAEAERSLLADGGLQDSLQRLADAHAELAASIPLQVAGTQATRAAMQRIYRRGRQQSRRAARSGEPAQMHIWRKRVKDLRHAAEALAAHGPTGSRRRMLRTARAADALGEALGEEHDLATLAERVAAERDLFAQEETGRKALLKAIARRRRELRKQTLRDGRKLYRRTPSRFTRPLAGPRL